VKAFDTIQHELLYQILAKYGLPNELIKVIKKMYSNCKVKLSIGKADKEIDYETGVQQGDNMAPTLFLFMMQAIMETLQLPTVSKAKF